MALKHGDGVMCTSQEQWERITEKLKGMGLRVYPGHNDTTVHTWPYIGWSGGDNHISRWQSGRRLGEMPEADFLAACKEEAIRLGVYKEDGLEEGDVCLVVGPDCSGGNFFIGETVTVVTDAGPHHHTPSQRVSVRTGWGPIWLPITSLQKITTPDDDEIRVGDMVEIVDDSGCHAAHGKRGNRYTVDAVEGPWEYDMVECAGIRMFRIRFKKIKAGGPVSTNKTTNQHGQVQGTSDKDSAGAAGRTAQRPDAGRQGATGGRHQGQRASRPASRWRGAKGSLRFTV